MRARTVLAIVLLALALGCKSKPTLVGRWTGKLDVSGTSVDMDITFDKAGTLAFKQTMMGHSSIQRGTYKEGEKTIDFTATSVESPNLSKAQLDQVNAQVKAANKTVTFDLVWKNPDQITISQRGAPAPLDKPIELARQKS